MRIKSKIKNFILKTIAWTVTCTALLAGIALDSESWVPLIALTVCGAYLALFSYANNWFEGRFD